MNILGEKVILRALEPEDNAILLDLINDPEIEAMLGGSSFPVSQKLQEKWLDNQNNDKSMLRCAIAVKEKREEAVGTVILSDIDYINGVAQLHIKISSKWQGKGLGADAVNTVVKYAFGELRVNCIYACVLAYNVNSKKLFEKCGFSYEGTHRARIFKGGKYNDLMVYSILKSDVPSNV